MKKLVFDTLSYAKMLEKGQVEHADVHAFALADAIVQNIYTKDEVDKMIDAALKRVDESLKQFEERTREMREEFNERVNRFDERTYQLTLEMKSIENRFEKALNRNLYATISILGGLIVVVGAIATFAHAFFH